MKKYPVKKIISLIILSCAFTFISCNSQDKANPGISKIDTIPKVSKNDISIPGSFSPQTKLKFDSLAVKIFFDSFPAFKPLEKDLAGFYRSRNYAYAWYDESGMIEPAENLFNKIQNISEEGVPDKLPYRAAFSNLMEAKENNNSASSTLELMLTAQYLGYAKTVWEGVSEKQMISIQWLLPRKETSYKALLDSIVSGKDVLLNAPVFRQYGLLKEQLKKFNAIKSAGGWPEIKADKKTYKIGDTSVIISQIRQHLFLVGDLEDNNQANLFDASLEEAVKLYEKRHGFKADGIITSPLIAAMNVPVEKRLEQIIVNMERCRWVPVQLKEEFILVNIPDFKLYVYNKDSLVMSMNTVVGKDQNQTVIFNDQLKYVVFSPYWNIPASILKKETLPAMKRNPRYLAQHNMEWNGGNVRQLPGPNNSLGLVKFLFPNSHSIYLHDTPAKSLFNEDKRAFSHGCIRIAEPKKLAQYLLRNDPNWDETKITAAMNKKSEQYVTLKKTVPVFIAYFTSWVDRDGKLNFRDDVYKRDDRLAKMILEKAAL